VVRIANRPRARDLGIPFEGTTGPYNAITDVPGVRVGHTTIIRDGKSDYSDAVRTGVTAILPRTNSDREPVFAGWFRLNGYGEMTGTAWIDEAGILDGPVMSTNTLSIGAVHTAVVEYAARHGLPAERWSLPVVGETWDGYLNDIRGFYVRPEDAIEAIDGAKSGGVPEGNVGGGTGMVCYDFKGGIGSASRQVQGREPYTLGVLVQANHGRRSQLKVAGIPVGRQLSEGRRRSPENGSILGFVATDAPLLPHQLARLARRCSMGLARSGSISGNGSGDLFLAFSTANEGAVEGPDIRQVRALPEKGLDPIFRSVVEATDEAIVNCLVAAETMVGVEGHRVEAMPHDALTALLRENHRLE
jgi:D-aminopeptidase